MKKNRILTWCLAFSVLLCSVMGCTQAEPTAVPTSAPTAAPTEAPTEEPTTEKEALPVPIVEKGQSDYVIIYSAELDDDDTDSSTAESNTDLEVDLAKQVRSLIKTLTGCELALSTDAEAPAKHEILIGTTNREESRDFFRQHCDRGIRRGGDRRKDRDGRLESDDADERAERVQGSRK
ncbi:MAG: PT domain-containing protein [Lachnospiraceae bacterium]|nr:PT domain-containing protein [Lachnospiraceae bacterium]